MGELSTRKAYPEGEAKYQVRVLFSFNTSGVSYKVSRDSHILIVRGLRAIV